MYKKLLESADIEWMAILPLIIFVTFFVVVIIRVVRSKQSFIDKMANLPLEDDDSVPASSLESDN